jgi:chemotaxis protein CheD
MMDAPNRLERRRRESAEIFDGQGRKPRYFDAHFNATAVKVLPGDHYVTDSPDEMIVTVLGSCVAACIRDTLIGVGGMNHFMLPESADGGWGTASASMRYGNFAMEQLINDILKAGGARNRLEVKVFGGGNVLVSSAGIGHRNADFVEEYLRNEGLAIAASDLRGLLPRRVHYFPHTGRVMMLALKRQEDLAVLGHEQIYKSRLGAAPVSGDAELF